MYCRSPSRDETSSPPPGRCPRVVGVRRVPAPAGVGILEMRWYLRYGLSYCDHEELLAECEGAEDSSALRFRRLLTVTSEPSIGDEGTAA